MAGELWRSISSTHALAIAKKFLYKKERCTYLPKIASIRVVHFALIGNATPRYVTDSIEDD